MVVKTAKNGRRGADDAATFAEHHSDTNVINDDNTVEMA